MRGTHEKVLLEKYNFYLLFKFFFINFDAVVASRHLIFKKKML